MPKRKDNKGRALKTGESQRKDSLYLSVYGQPRQTIYASTQAELREKESEIDEYKSPAWTMQTATSPFWSFWSAIKQGVRYNTGWATTS